MILLQYFLQNFQCFSVGNPDISVYLDMSKGIILEISMIQTCMTHLIELSQVDMREKLFNGDAMLQELHNNYLHLKHFMVSIQFNN